MLTGRTPSYNSYRGHTLTTAPAIEPVSLSEVKAQLGIDGTADDTLLSMYITASREHAEQMTGLALITQTWTLTLDAWPGHGEPWWDGVRDMAISALRSAGRPSNILLPRYPLRTVESVTADGVAVTVADVFTVDNQQRPGRLVIKNGATWPTVLETANGISIEYTAGYGATASSVPAALRVGLLQMVASLYTHRGDQCSVADAWKSSGAESAFNAYRARVL